jgi:exopolysaccharide biosynthesis protein
MYIFMLLFIISYFWRVDIEGFWRDNVCRGKLRSEAEQEASDENPNYGIGDGLVMIDGKKYSNNCNCSGYSRPAVLKLTGSESDIEVLHRGETIQDPTVTNSIAAGPNLVSYDATTGTSFIDIPEDDDNINKFVFEATTAVGVVRDPAAPTLVMVTTDGSDSCLPGEPWCGLISPDLASLMLEVFKCTVAMSMDQGGSTTMWVEGENPERSEWMQI